MTTPIPGTVIEVRELQATCSKCLTPIVNTGVGWWHEKTSMPDCPDRATNH